MCSYPNRQAFIHVTIIGNKYKRMPDLCENSINLITEVTLINKLKSSNLPSNIYCFGTKIMKYIKKQISFIF